MPLCKWHTFWMALCLICYFIAIFYIERKWIFLRNLASILSLKSKLSGKFQRFNAIDGSSKCWKIVEFPKLSIKMKNCEIFYKAETASCLKNIQPSPNPPIPADKILLHFWNNKLFTEIYRRFAGKFEKYESFLAVLPEHIAFNVKWVEFPKMSEVFWVKLYSL